MIRNLKVLALAVGAVLALTAMMASAASAAQYTASEYPANATGSNTKGSEVFTTEGGKVECDSHFETKEAIAEPTATITITAHYTNCEAFGFLSATVNMEGCHYHFTLQSNSSNTVDVICPAGQSIKITASSCKVEIKGQTGLNSVPVSTSGSSVLAKPNVSGIAYTVTQDGFLCPFSGTGNKTGATYTGEVTLSRVGGGSISVS
jgi:hypothetical protein